MKNKIISFKIKLFMTLSLSLSVVFLICALTSLANSGFVYTENYHSYNNYDNSSNVYSPENFSLQENSSNYEITDIENINVDFGNFKGSIYSTKEPSISIVSKSNEKIELSDIVHKNSVSDLIINFNNLNNLNIKNASFKLYIPESFSKNLNIASYNNDINLDNMTLNTLNISSDDADIEVSKSNIQILDLNSNSGDINIETLNVPSLLTINTTSSEIDLTLPKDSLFNLNYQTTFGVFDNQFGPFEKSNVSQNFYSLNNGYSENIFNINTHDGNLKLDSL